MPCRGDPRLPDGDVASAPATEGTGQRYILVLQRLRDEASELLGTARVVSPQSRGTAVRQPGSQENRTKW